MDEVRCFLMNEGAAVLKRNGRIFMTYSASATDENYCMGLLTADEHSDLLDPASWMKSSEPIFTTSFENRQFGPGHNSFTVTEDGRHDLLVFHARNYTEIEGDPLYDPNRHTRVQLIHWNEDGTPHFGIPRADNHLCVNEQSSPVRAIMSMAACSNQERTFICLVSLCMYRADHIFTMIRM